MTGKKNNTRKEYAIYVIIDAEFRYFYVGNKEIEMKDSSNIYYTGIDEFWVNVSEIKHDSKGYYFEMKFDGTLQYKNKTYKKLSDFSTTILLSSRSKTCLSTLYCSVILFPIIILSP